MGSRIPRLTLVVAAAVAVTVSPIASSSQSASTSYSDVVELFRRGDDELALQQLALMTDSAITVGRDAIFKTFVSGNFAEVYRAAAMIRAASVLHTVRAFGARSHDDVLEFQYQFKLARAYIDMLVAKDGHATPFVKTWQLFVVSSYHWQMEVSGAREFARSVRDRRGDSPLFLLALGATEEMGWTAHQEEATSSSVDGDLKDAEKDYRQALVMAPELVEARLRLGRVLGLRKDGEALRVLQGIGDTIEAPYQYLARLFEGDLDERAGNLAEAERQYLAAVSLMTQAQSAFIALAHVRHARGARTDAAQDIRVTTGAKAVPDTADPWFWYMRGTGWRAPVYLDDLHKMIEP